MIYYAQRKSVKDGQPVAPNKRYGERNEMERQFHLYCASACINTDDFDTDAIECGTIEQGVIERKRYQKPVSEQDIEPEESI